MGHSYGKNGTGGTLMPWPKAQSPAEPVHVQRVESTRGFMLGSSQPISGARSMRWRNGVHKCLLCHRLCLTRYLCTPYLFTVSATGTCHLAPTRPVSSPLDLVRWNAQLPVASRPLDSALPPPSSPISVFVVDILTSLRLLLASTCIYLQSCMLSPLFARPRLCLPICPSLTIRGRLLASHYLSSYRLAPLRQFHEPGEGFPSPSPLPTVILYPRPGSSRHGERREESDH